MVLSWRSFLSCNHSTGVVNNGLDLFVGSVWDVNGPVFGFLSRRMGSHMTQRYVIVSLQCREKRLPVYAFEMCLNQKTKSAVISTPIISEPDLLKWLLEVFQIKCKQCQGSSLLELYLKIAKAV